MNTFCQISESSTETVRKLRVILERNIAVNESSTRRLLVRFQTTILVCMFKSFYRRCCCWTDEQIAIVVLDCTTASLEKSIFDVRSRWIFQRLLYIQYYVIISMYTHVKLNSASGLKPIYAISRTISRIQVCCGYSDRERKFREGNNYLWQGTLLFEWICQ